MNFAIIGTSGIAETFVKSLRLSNSALPYAVCSRDESRGRMFAERYDIIHSYSSLEEMLGDAEIDAVYVASPNFAHAAQSIMAMQSGKHVLCEKPAAVTLKELNEMLKTARENNVIFLEAMMSAHSPGLNMIKSAMERLGTIYSASIDFSQLSSKYPRLLAGELPNIFNPEMKTGALMDLGVYNIYAALELFGEPDGVVSAATFLETGADISGGAIFKYPDKTVTLTYSKAGQSYGVSQIFGENGTISIESISRLDGITLHTKNGTEIIVDKFPQCEIMKNEINDFVDFVNNGTGNERFNRLSLSSCRLIEKIRSQNGFLF